MDIKEKIKSLIQKYAGKQEMGCSATVLSVLSDLFNIKVEKQVMACLIGMEGGSNFKNDCGLLDGSLMFIGIMLSQQGLPEPLTKGICRQFTGSFEIEFGESSVINSCSNEGTCLSLTPENIFFVYKFIKNIAGENNPLQPAGKF